MLRCPIAFFHALAGLATVLLLAGCSTLSPYSTLTKVNLTLTGSDQLNPDLHGRPSPIVVQLFELKHPVAFENADFFSLYERARQSLATDLVASEELELRPGDSAELKLSLQADSRYVGVLAAYRDLLDTRWRYVAQVVPGQVADIDLILEPRGIRKAHESLAKAQTRP